MHNRSLAIEAHKSVERRQPHVAIARLGYPVFTPRSTVSAIEAGRLTLGGEGKK